mmetsp:Transcript_15644/g.24765  ORF Transcript_15644/g.24765 Transcript_15644/m.24765 type:complete len:276 (+) Transcript_15644:609-1436(+)
MPQAELESGSTKSSDTGLPPGSFLPSSSFSSSSILSSSTSPRSSRDFRNNGGESTGGDGTIAVSFGVVCVGELPCRSALTNCQLPTRTFASVSDILSCRLPLGVVGADLVSGNPTPSSPPSLVLAFSRISDIPSQSFGVSLDGSNLGLKSIFSVTLNPTFLGGGDGVSFRVNPTFFVVEGGGGGHGSFELMKWFSCTPTSLPSSVISADSFNVFAMGDEDAGDLDAGDLGSLLRNLASDGGKSDLALEDDSRLHRLSSFFIEIVENSGFAIKGSM